MEFVLVLVVLLLVVAGGVTTAAVVGTRRAVHAVRGSGAVRRGRELGGYAALAAGAVRDPRGTDRTSAGLALRVTAASMSLQREVAAARRVDAHLGDVPDVLPGLADEAHALSRALRLAATAPTTRSAELHDAARAHLAAVAEVTGAVRASAALPAAHGPVAAEAARAAADLQAYAAAYRDLVRPDAPR
ncbi:hypothetical protein SAMN05660199_02748 [Klenkia soli]|uniref:Uncharacterized protein n=1 Tax=Klenkia soli TaxID=1052260 RepID=A0A1H0N5A0_9ACTN|nr:hypothetical protein [Klenkia soli]SDO87879.1 hypothetical protein SAMN05660199_02748 [Klenkia soli]